MTYPAASLTYPGTACIDPAGICDVSVASTREGVPAKPVNFLLLMVKPVPLAFQSSLYTLNETSEAELASFMFGNTIRLRLLLELYSYPDVASLAENVESANLVFDESTSGMYSVWLGMSI